MHKNTRDSQLISYILNHRRNNTYSIMYRLLKKHFSSLFKLFFASNRMNFIYFSNGWTRTKCEEGFFFSCVIFFFLSPCFSSIKTKGY